MTNQADHIRPPRRTDLKKKHEQIKAIRDRPMTNVCACFSPMSINLTYQEEINRQIEARKKNNPSAQRNAAFQIAQLMSSRDLAIRRNDLPGADAINRQILQLGADPQNGEIITTDSAQVAANVSEYDVRIQKINENNKRKTKETMQAAHAAAIQRKRAEEAIVQAKQCVARNP